MIVITGSASGIGQATRSRLERDGHRVVGVDLRDAEIRADLATPEGRGGAMAAIVARCEGRLDGIVVCAGIGPQGNDLPLIVSLNYFGAQIVLAAARPLLAQGALRAAVAVSSNSSTLPGTDGPLVDACLAGDEAGARRVATELYGQQVYAGSKLALARWVRRHATLPEWAGAGIRLNAVAPGAVRTPLLQAGLEHPLYGPAIRNFPIPLGGFGDPEQVAAAIAFLLSPDASFCCGSILFVDGGSDAMLRADAF